MHYYYDDKYTITIGNTDIVLAKNENLHSHCQYCVFERTNLGMTKNYNTIAYNLNDQDALLIFADQIKQRVKINMPPIIENTQQIQEQGIIFSQIELWTDTGEDCEFFMGGVPESCEDTEDCTDFGEFVEQLSIGDTKEITAYVTTFSEGEGNSHPAEQTDIERIYNAIADVDIDTITGWKRIGESQFTFGYDIDELFRMKGIE